MEAVLFVGHGSRDKEGNEEVRAFVNSMLPQIKTPIIETCFLEFEKPNINQGIDTCIDKGATKVVVIPIILLGAGHSKIHIPAAIDEAKEQYPQTEFVYGRPIGVHDLVIDILNDRLQHTSQFNEKELAEETAVLIVGRGSSEPDANSDVYKISRLFWEKMKVKWVETAFIGVTFPSMDEGIERCIKLGAKNVIILPYFLFTGILIKRMEDMLKTYQHKYENHQFQLGEYFGFHPNLQEVLIERVKEALQDEVKMNCDNCTYRLDAMKHIDHHHHHDHDHDHHHV
ncbi:sirohydrochlorin chelatase [Chengkuizengella axinellae]|uniref:Sirohydrochlorin chelatase n=1 Tax=Chengkuizengella axinellae TaxID=3064388 RepID=A0ABT9IYE6_9BACL|nr:sirohydrochlorin chelatase [Chengkuizengella sp. 2205SS18-9]MDP5274172.1 sirohydrochlorin chelatase [Chengkuizengella sp. 2205SS18-9]